MSEMQDAIVIFCFWLLIIPFGFGPFLFYKAKFGHFLERTFILSIVSVPPGTYTLDLLLEK